MSRLAHLVAIVRFLWNSTKGYRLRPWASPYLRWRIETYSGHPAGQISVRDFWRFTYRQRRELVRFLIWAGEMGSRRQGSPSARESSQAVQAAPRKPA